MGKRRVLINILVADATSNIFHNDEVRAIFFARTGCLVGHAKSKDGDLIKSHSVTGKMSMSDSYVDN